MGNFSKIFCCFLASLFPQAPVAHTESQTHEGMHQPVNFLMGQQVHVGEGHLWALPLTDRLPDFNLHPCGSLGGGLIRVYLYPVDKGIQTQDSLLHSLLSPHGPTTFHKSINFHNLQPTQLNQPHCKWPLGMSLEGWGLYHTRVPTPLYPGQTCVTNL